MMYGSNGYLKIMILTLLLDRYIGTKKKRKNKRANICDGRERSIFLPSSSADGLCFRGEEREERVKSSAFIQLKYNTTCYNVDTLSILLFLRIFPMLFVKELVHIVLWTFINVTWNDRRNQGWDTRDTSWSKGKTKRNRVQGHRIDSTNQGNQRVDSPLPVSSSRPGKRGWEDRVDHIRDSIRVMSDGTGTYNCAPDSILRELLLISSKFGSVTEARGM